MKKSIKLNSNKIRNFNLSFLVYLIIGIVGFVIIVFLINQQQKKVTLYATGLMGANQDIFIAVPYWVANGINVGDKDKSIIGNINAEITDKLSYEGGSHGKHVVLQMKLTAFKDNSGKFYYRNQPLEVNKWFDLRFGRVNEKVYLIYLDLKPQKNISKKLRITIKKAKETSYVTDNLAINDEMHNNKGEVMAKIVNKSLEPAEIRSYSQNGLLTLLRDPNAKDLYLTVDVSVLMHDNIDYFGEIRKIKAGEKINLFFNKATLWDGIIVSVNDI